MPFLSKRKLRPRDDAELGELNVVPYLDILMNLIIFILLSMTGLATFGALNVSAQSPNGIGTAQPEQLLTVAISNEGYSLGATTVPRKGGSYDHAALTAQLTRIKAGNPAASTVLVTADDDVPYEVLIATMDAVRETADHTPLFPHVTLSRAP